METAFSNLGLMNLTKCNYFW